MCGTLDNMELGQKLRFILSQKHFVPDLFLSSRAYRDPTVPITQCNRLCHVTDTISLSQIDYVDPSPHSPPLECREIGKEA
jgi:hypothetical protein